MTTGKKVNINDGYTGPTLTKIPPSDGLNKGLTGPKLIQTPSSSTIQTPPTVSKPTVTTGK